MFWDEDIIIPIAFMVTVVILAIGIPLVRALARKWERQPVRPELPADLRDRLARIEQGMDSIAIEVERISEGQRFTTRLFADRAGAVPQLTAPAAGAAGDSNSRGGGRHAQ
jgi:hypothetical protein